jgi:uncharacterized protein (DUF1697 family)
MVKMERLRSLFTEMGFTKVGTFIQSGNVFFQSESLDRAALRSQIESRLKEGLGFEVPTTIRTLDEVRAAVATDPFKGIEAGDDLRFVVVFTYDPVSIAGLDPKRAEAKGFTFLGQTDGEIFVLMRQDPGRPGNPVAFLEKELKRKDRMTARFFGATAKLLDAAEAHFGKPN